MTRAAADTRVMPMVAKFISIQQPYSWAICKGWKPVENRSRNIAGTYRGSLFIHAGKVELIRDVDWVITMIADHTGRGFDSLLRDYRSERSLGAIVGHAELVNVVDGVTAHTHASAWFSGPVGLILAHPEVCLRPVPMRGALGIQSCEAALADQARRHMVPGTERAF